MADEKLTDQEKMDRMIADLSNDIDGINENEKVDDQELEKKPAPEKEVKEEKQEQHEENEEEGELTDQEKMDRMIADLSNDIDGINENGKVDDQELEKKPAPEKEVKEEKQEQHEENEEETELTDQEKMDRMIADLSNDIDGINENEKMDNQELEKKPAPEKEVKEEKQDQQTPKKEKDPKKPVTEEMEDESDTTITGESEEDENNLKKTEVENREPSDKPEEKYEDKTEDPTIERDLYQEGTDANKEPFEDIDAWDDYPDIEEDGRKTKKRRSAIIWCIIAILMLVGFFAWFFYYKDVKISDAPFLSQKVRKPIEKPVVHDTKGSESQRPNMPATELHGKAPQAAAFSSLKEVTSGHLTKSEIFEQKMQQILAVREKLSEKRIQAASIRKKLNEQMLTLKLEILAEKRALGIDSYEKAVNNFRIYNNIKLIQQLKAYSSKLSERIKYYEDGYEKMEFCYQKADDDIKMIGLWSDAKIKRLLAKIDKAIKEYTSVNNAHMFTNKQIVLDNPRKVWIEVMQSTGGE